MFINVGVELLGVLGLAMVDPILGSIRLLEPVLIVLLLLLLVQLLLILILHSIILLVRRKLIVTRMC